MRSQVCSCFLFAFFSLTHVICAQRSRNPCHDGRSVESLGTDCEYITMPPELCRDCRLAGFDSGGYFNDCSAIYNLRDDRCRKALELYAKLNPCDTIRRAQIKTYNKPESRVALDYFTYSICEECCDCIPRGAKPDQFRARLLNKTLISFRRGNCPAHAHYDVCRVWPEVRYITTPGRPLRKGLPKICPIIRDWFFSDASKDWYKNDNTQMDPRIMRFLRIYARSARCYNKQTWLMCHGLESRQNRV